MKRYPLGGFPKKSLKPEVVAKHEEYLHLLDNDINTYSTVGHRDTSMFDWLLMVFENLGLSTIQKDYLESLAVTKTRLAMFVVLIDDPVDNSEKRNFKLFEELAKIPFSSNNADIADLTSDDAKYLKFAKELWERIIDDVKKYPNYEKYKGALEFDLEQLINSMRYSKFVNTYPNAINMIENDAYVHHSMIVLIQMDLDLMCSRSFDDKEFGKLRELGYISQKMAKIGNLIGTYPRELIESDMSSEAIVKFVTEFGTDFSFKLNRFLNKESRYPKFEEKLIEEWQINYNLAKKISEQIKSVDTEEFLNEREFIQEAYMTKLDYW